MVGRLGPQLKSVVGVDFARSAVAGLVVAAVGSGFVVQPALGSAGAVGRHLKGHQVDVLGSEELVAYQVGMETDVG